MDNSSMADDSLRRVFTRADAIIRKYAKRDARARDVRCVRAGDFDAVAPGIFPPEWPRPTVANLIDTMARDFAASFGQLPTISCSATSMLTERARDFANKRSKIANNYVQFSNLAAQMVDAVDGYNCYGLFAASAEPDFEAKMPRLRVHDGASVYPLWDQNMRTIAVVEKWTQDVVSLEAEYPALASLRDKNPGCCPDGKYELVKYVDDATVILYIPKLGNYVLTHAANVLGKCYYVCVARPSGEGMWYRGDLHGAYDDLIWPQLARNQFQMLAMEAADKSIRAPLAIPMDVPDLPEGPDAVVRSNTPEKIRRVAIDVPPQAFQSMQWLERDMQLGGMTTQSRMGQQGTGWTTGRGLEQLGDGFSTQGAAAQEMLKFALRQLLCLCFEWDERLWPDLKKKIRGHDNGVPFETTYTPSKDIDGDHTVEVTYGYMTGQDPNRALVVLLQGMGSGLISKDTAARNFPGMSNGPEELKKVDLEQMRTHCLQVLGGLADAIPTLAAQGQDVSGIAAKVAQIATEMQKGGAIEDVMLKVFAPQPPPQPAAPQMPGADQSMPQDQGAPQGALPGATPPDGGRPPLQMLFAGLTRSGAPNLQAGVSRMPQAAQ